MPTLVNLPDTRPGADDDGSETIYDSDDSTVINEDIRVNSDSGGGNSQKGGEKDNQREDSEAIASPILRERSSNTKSVAFDESTILLSERKRSSKKSHSRRDTLHSDVSLLSFDTNRDREALLDANHKNDKSVTFDESMILVPRRQKGSPETQRHSRRDTLNSDVSLLSCDTNRVNNESLLTTNLLNNDDRTHDRHQESSVLPPNRSRPKRDEYQQKYESYVKSAISDFRSRFPGKLRDYRSMSREEKAIEQQKVLALLTRLRVSKHGGGGSPIGVAQAAATSPSAQGHGSFRSPISSNRLLDETLSPMFSPNAGGGGEADNIDTTMEVPSSPLNGHESKEHEDSLTSIHQNNSKNQCEKSALLLSMDDGNGSGVDAGGDGDDVPCGDHQENHDDDFEFPVNVDNEGEDGSNSSMELVRQAAADDDYNSDPILSCTTPDRLATSNKTSRKRGATSSGKKGADSRRCRHDSAEDEYRHPKVDRQDISVRFRRLSVSPSLSSPPQDLFLTSQSPISPRLTYNSPDSDKSENYSAEDYVKRISLGRDSNERRESHRRISRRESSYSNDSLATNTPPKRYRDKETRRAFRDVPVNVVLKKGATFHLEKIAVKQTERLPSKQYKAKNGRTKAPQRRKLVNFPDPLAGYGSRRRRALKEMYSWVKRAEHDYEYGRCIVPAVGAFFSLTEEQIIDVSLKLLLADYNEKSHERDPPDSQYKSVLKGNTLVVVRTKEDTASWENALREGTGCSVLNHSSLPLSERIRATTSEKACLYDVVLTTYDAMKSPDISIPVSSDGHGILTNTQKTNGWQRSRSASHQDESLRQNTKQLSVLHRVQFKRIIFVDMLGRKCYLAKSGTARAAASVALCSSSCRLVFFKETEADGSNALFALRKSDKRAFQSVSSVLHLTDETGDSSDTEDSRSGDEDREDPFENVAMDLKDLIC